MTEFVSIDFETRSPVDLLAAGVARYAEHPDTDVWCMAWVIGENPDAVRVWEREDRACPPEILAALERGAYIRAWNAAFERVIWNEVMVKKYGWPPMPTHRFVCTMALAAAGALPLGLDNAARALRLDMRKDDEGYKLMKRMSRPRATTETGLVWWDEPDKRALLSRYCAQDVRVELAAWQKLPPAMNARERAIWLLDQRINDRGIAIDLPFVSRAARLVAIAKPARDALLAEVTGGLSVTQVQKLQQWFLEHGLMMPSLNKATVAEALAIPDLPPDLRLVLEARRDGAKSSTAKYAAMLAAVCKDGRVRGTMQYFGATTGRWAGRGVQPHNNPRPTRSPEELERLRPDLLSADLNMIEVMHGPVLPILSDFLRSMFVAGPGKKLAVVDYSTIEARVVAWLAGQDDLVEAFRSGAKLYEEMGAMAHNIPLEEVIAYKKETGRHHPVRQDGKIGILGCGFGMGPKRASDQYGIPIELATRIVNLYRERYEKVVGFWWHLNDAANTAVRDHCAVEVPETRGRLRFEWKPGYLLLHLPSGRALWYHEPLVRTYRVQRFEKVIDPLTGAEVTVDKSFDATGVEVSTLNPVTKQWGRQMMYGGLWAENATQAVARDIMADGLLRCEKDGRFLPVLSVHDEVVAECENDAPLESFIALLTTVPEWAAGLPVAAEGAIGDRYAKD